MTEQQISQELRDRVLAKLGFADPPSLNLDGLSTLYSAWCRSVPFDNIRKLIHVSEENPGVLPGNEPSDFFEAWLKHKTGGTCWAGNGALHALLEASGFNAVRGVATMLVAPHLPPNHGTVVVNMDGAQYWVDASILHVVPIRITENNDQHIPFGIKLDQRDGHWFLRWAPFNHPQGLDCRLDYVPTDREDFSSRHEETRAWSPFNYQLTVRTMRGQCAVGTSLGRWMQLSHSGDLVEREVTLSERREMLINTIGYSEEIVSRLPPDRPTPPPPGSETAKRAAAAMER